MIDDEFNKECAEALEWTHEKSLSAYHAFHVPKYAFDAGVIDTWPLIERPSMMHFHDSYDWAMLLVAKVLEDVEMTAKLLNKYLWDLGRFLTLTPQQLSQSCLEVLD